MTSNSKARIAELRKEIHKYRRYAQRAKATAEVKQNLAYSSERTARMLEDEIKSMGGRVKS